MKKCASLEDHNHVGNEAEFLAEKIMLEMSVKAQVLELKYFKCCDILQYWLAIPFILPSIFYFRSFFIFKVESVKKNILKRIPKSRAYLYCCVINVNI